MTDTSFDAARRCPICGELGAQENRKPLRNGGTSFTFACHNNRCRWYDQPGWVVDVRADGTLPNPERHRSKAFPKMPDHTERMREVADRQIAGELTKGTEVNRRG